MNASRELAARLQADEVLTAKQTVKHATFEEICRLHLPRVYAFLRSQVSRPELAEELTGRVLIKGYARWQGHRCGDGTVAWLFRAARTTLIDYWRVEGRRERASVELDELEELPASGMDPEAALLTRERQRLALQAISDLSEDQRILLALKFVGGCTNREMAPILRLSEAAVSMRLLRALRTLRERLIKVGLS